MEWAFSVEKRQNGGRLTQRGLCVSLPFNWADFCGEGTGHFTSSGFGSRFGTNTKLFRGVIGPISTPNDYLNAADSMMLLACARAAETMPCQGRRGKAFINLLQFFPWVWQVIPYNKAICYLLIALSNRNIITCRPWLARWALNAISHTK